jgi:thiol-disulfide isomerase/thioredoxin
MAEEKIVRINRWKIATLVLIIILAVVIFFGLQFGFGTESSITSQEASNRSVNFINKNLASLNATATFVSVSEFSNLYNVTISYLNNLASVYVTKDGSYIFLAQPLELKETTNTQKTIGNFLIDENGKICEENGKPIVYFFGSNDCPHCKWEHPIFVNVTNNFKDEISYHENIDTQTDSNIFSLYSPDGYIPTLVIGCKYFRVGSGENLGEAQENNILTALICKLTDSKPSSACYPVEDLIKQIP